MFFEIKGLFGSVMEESGYRDLVIIALVTRKELFNEEMGIVKDVGVISNVGAL
jgi:hypothetical protein